MKRKRKGGRVVAKERLERVCGRLCLLSSLDRSAGDPPALSRRAVKQLIEQNVLDGLVLRESDSVSPASLERARRLLGRASSVYESLIRYLDTGYEILLPDDDRWPARLFSLGSSMPEYLFARGNTALLNQKTMALAGSRDILPQTADAAEKIGRVAARDGWTLVCGGARGADRAAMHGALLHGGSVIVIPAVPAFEVLKDSVCRDALDAGRLLILCETPPDERFSPAKALARNHTIYALGVFALVVASRRSQGGSFSGARDCLKGKWTPVYVLNETGRDFEGNAVLEELGARSILLSDIESGNPGLFSRIAAPCVSENPVCQISLF